MSKEKGRDDFLLDKHGCAKRERDLPALKILFVLFDVFGIIPTKIVEPPTPTIPTTSGDFYRQETPNVTEI